MTVENQTVSRKRYERSQKAQQEAEHLLEAKSRELYLANKQLSLYSSELEGRILERTKELQAALERAQSEALARTRFIATMSHEIRTPLGGLLGMIDLLSFEETDPEKLELLKIANESGSSLRRIVNDVLDFSKMESGVMRFDREEVDIRALTQGVVQLASTNPKGIDREIQVEISKETPFKFWGDATRVRQVISNFVNNALNYSSEGPIFIRVLRFNDNILRMEVQDYGVGVAPEKMDRLFKDFSQISNTLTSEAEGTGLGLAISKRIVEGIGGQIGVQSELGRGSTFWFEIPMEIMAEHTQSEAKTTLEDVDLTGRRILLVEDNIINQKLLTKNLDRMGITVTLAENGLIACEKFQPGQFDLILMDIAMPVMDGLEATQKIRASWPHKDIPPIFALTAHIMDAVEEDAARVGIDRVLTKPLPYKDFRDEIAMAIGSHTEEIVEIVGSNSPFDKNVLDAIGKRMKADALEQLLTLFSESETVNILEKFKVDLSVRFQKITDATEARDKQIICNEAHSIRGAANVIGFEKLGGTLSTIEAFASKNLFDEVAKANSMVADELNWLATTLGSN